MRFSGAAIIGAFSVALFAPSAHACERECQVNVSRAFADKYEVLSNNYFTILSDKVQESLFDGIPSVTLTYTEKENVLSRFQDWIVSAQTAWDSTVFQTVFDTIFKDEPKFKGDCNHPHRVIQPRRGVNWTMSDCHKMDYICGNPPSICHFMPMIKTRIVNKLKFQLVARFDGFNSDIFVNSLSPALQTVLTDLPLLQAYVTILNTNLGHILDSIKEDIIDFADDSQWKREWDSLIKYLLLTFP
ncbi:hypothetical protein BGZ65_004151 [Modicella reniformis]|uniref:Uncharacterized protein n=1 Tax=Modicella reniformis TaxID=1440133 RepID=A0A9P6LSH7_9FUNG|nr:hypothetical protein BGZ65_004151 [Modicella reniformis]